MSKERTKSEPEDLITNWGCGIIFLIVLGFLYFCYRVSVSPIQVNTKAETLTNIEKVFVNNEVSFRFLVRDPQTGLLEFKSSSFGEPATFQTDVPVGQPMWAQWDYVVKTRTIDNVITSRSTQNIIIHIHDTKQLEGGEYTIKPHPKQPPIIIKNIPL